MTATSPVARRPKIYDQSCAIGPAAILARGVTPGAILLEVRRDGAIEFAGSIDSTEMIRRPEVLIAALRNCYTLPDGAWLLTGTGIVPPDEFSLEPGDEVTIEIAGLGRLRNPVVIVGSPVGDLCETG